MHNDPCVRSDICGRTIIRNLLGAIPAIQKFSDNSTITANFVRTAISRFATLEFRRINFTVNLRAPPITHSKWVLPSQRGMFALP